MEVKADDDDNLPEFFKVYISHHSSQKMSIPSEFVEYMGVKKSGTAGLACPSGQTWDVELVQDGKDIDFSDGWQSFVQDNMIRDGDFLFFKFHGNLMFSVVIYDESTCEKGVTFVDEYSQGRDDVRKSGQGEAGAKPVKSRKVGRSKPKGSAFIEEKQNAPAMAMPSFVNPSFVKHMRKYNVDRNYVVSIPSWFIRENSLHYKNKETMVLRTKTDSSWPVNIIQSRRFCCFSGGWTAFIRDNNIKEGDTCKFELMSRLEMKVHLTHCSKQG